MDHSGCSEDEDTHWHIRPVPPIGDLRTSPFHKIGPGISRVRHIHDQNTHYKTDSITDLSSVLRNIKQLAVEPDTRDGTIQFSGIERNFTPLLLGTDRN